LCLAWPGIYGPRMDRPRVVLAEDHAEVAEELRKLLEAEFDVRVEARRRPRAGAAAPRRHAG